jgi:hypothetical protein
MDRKTAVLATLVGTLFAATTSSAEAKLDARTARELAVLSRVLERRLSEGRKALAQVVPVIEHNDQYAA